jgi:RNA polymerase sigma-70 factor, ECF subfamily
MTTAFAATTNSTPIVRSASTAFVSDQEMIDRVLAGDQIAASALVARYRRLVYSVALETTGHHQALTEIVQDTFVKAFRYMPSWRADARFSTWIYRIARTVAIDFIRRDATRQKYDTLPDSALLHHADPTLNAQEYLVRNEHLAEVRRALDQLRPNDRAVLSLFYFEEKSLAEICEIMSWELSNGKSHLCRARRRLRDVLETVRA